MDFIESSNEQMKKLQDELESVKKQLLIQKEEYTKLKKINKQYINVITKNLAVKILEDLFDSGNLAITAKKFGCDPIALYPHIINWDGCSDGLQNLEDYYDFYYKLEGRRCEIGVISALECCELEEFEKKKRTPDQKSLDEIFIQYSSGEMTLYELADKSNIMIFNLFRLLKEHKLIEKESDAIGYEQFYKEYSGEYEYNKYEIKTDLGLIDIFYNNFV
jgi:hypothetical protein